MTRQERKRRKQAARRERIRLKKHRRRINGLPWDAPLDEDSYEGSGECGCCENDAEEEAETPVPYHVLQGRIATERLSWEIHGVIQERNFKTVAEVNAFLNSAGPSLEGLKSLRLKADGPERQAQGLAFDAMEAGDEERAYELARRAVEFDPDCVDALVILGEAAPSAQERLDRMKAAVAAAERSLGQEFIAENGGRFWFTQGTRPYMRALQALGFTCLENGRRQEARDVFEKMLDLNRDDNQGVRDLLLILYLEEPAPKRLGKLLDRYAEDASSLFLWGRVLERAFAGDSPGVEGAIRKAARQNPSALPYLAGLKPPPQHLPRAWSPGRESEAQYCAFFMAPFFNALFASMGAAARHRPSADFASDRVEA